MDERRCSSCGVIADDDSPTTFCGNCGALLPPPPPPAAADEDDTETRVPPARSSPPAGSAGGRWRVLTLGALVVLAAVVAIGLASDDDREVALDPDSAYLAAVVEVEQLRTAPLEDLSNILSRPYGSREITLEAYAEALAAVPVDAALERARALEPEQEYVDSHGLWLDMLERQQEIVQGMEAAVARDDLLGVTTGAIEIVRAELRTAHEAQPAFCLALSIQPDAFRQDPTQLCTASHDLPGGVSGRYLRVAAAEVYIDVLPRITAFDPSMDDTEFLALLTVIQPQVEAKLAEVAAQLADTRPPPGLADDTDALLTYLEGMGTIAAEITAAAQRGDREALDELFARSAGPGQRLAEELSDRGRELVGPLLLPGG